MENEICEDCVQIGFNTYICPNDHSEKSEESEESEEK